MIKKLKFWITKIFHFILLLYQYHLKFDLKLLNYQRFQSQSSKVPFPPYLSHKSSAYKEPKSPGSSQLRLYFYFLIKNLF